MLKEMLQNLMNIGYIVTAECSCLVVRDIENKEELEVISLFDKEKDIKLSNCYNRFVSQ